MRASDKEVAPQELALPGTRPTDLRRIVDTKSLAQAKLAHPSTEGPCACYGGLVFVGHLVEDEVGEEVEVVDAVPCRQCADEDRVTL